MGRTAEEEHHIGGVEVLELARDLAAAAGGVDQIAASLAGEIM